MSRPVAISAAIMTDSVTHRSSIPTPVATQLTEEIQPAGTIPKENLSFFLNKAWTFLTSMDKKKIFFNQVVTAPGCSIHIQNPMSLDSIQSKIFKLMYSTVDEFDADVQKMFQNFELWNEPESINGKYATTINQKWRKELRELREEVTVYTDELNAATRSQSPNASSIDKVDSNSTGRNIIVSEHSNNLVGDSSSSSGKRKTDNMNNCSDAHDALEGLAREEVEEKEDDEVAVIGRRNRIPANICRELSEKASLDLTSPDTLYYVLERSARYLRNCDERKHFARPKSAGVASKPKMALSKMNLKVKNREYSGGLNEFSDDVEFIVRNCNPVFYTAAERLLNDWKVLLGLIREKAAAASEIGSNIVAPPPPPPPPLQVPANNPASPSKVEDSEDEDDEPADIGHLNRIAAKIYRELSRKATASLDLTNPDTLYEVLKKSARYLRNCDEEDYFDKAPTNRVEPGYTQVIQTMIALSIMKTKVEAKKYSGGLDEFSADVELIVKNCGTFYSKASYLYTAAERLLKNWKLLSELIRKKAAVLPGLVPSELLQQKKSSAGYISGDVGIMLVRTGSLSYLFKKGGMTSEDLLKTYWQEDGNIYSLIPKDSFKEVNWADVPSTPYAVMSYQWQSKWGSIAEFILNGKERVLQEYMWIDVLCLDQMDPDKMTTIRRSDEIYYHANEYHLMEFGSLFRGWILFELSSVKETMLPPAIHFSTQDPAAINHMKWFLRSHGFDSCQFTEESDREIVKYEIIDQYGSIDEFNLRIIAILDKIFL